MHAIRMPLTAASRIARLAVARCARRFAPRLKRLGAAREDPPRRGAAIDRERRARDSRRRAKRDAETIAIAAFDFLQTDDVRLAGHRATPAGCLQTLVDPVDVERRDLHGKVPDTFQFSKYPPIMRKDPSTLNRGQAVGAMLAFSRRRSP